MIYKLHDYQEMFLADALAWVADAQPGARRLYASPTGTGKSVMELALQRAVPRSWLITPRVEIIRGMMDKLGDGEATLEAAWNTHRIITPIRLRNRLAKGDILERPPLLIIDEAHHDLASSYQEVAAYLGGVPTLGLTATPFRGTPKSTSAFLAQWGGEVTWVLDIRGAAARGVLAVPVPTVWPLVDDDTLAVVNGDIQVQAAGDAVKGRIGELVERCRGFVVGGRWDRPTMFAVPTTEVVGLLTTALNAAGLPAMAVTQATSDEDRRTAFRETVACNQALVQIAVVSEGVDLPIRRLIDLAPTLSPVRWLQQVGRICRPTDQPPEYICTNRNLARHCYLYEGLFPPAHIAAAQQAFDAPAKRDGARAIGLEAIGKFKAVELPLKDGLTGQMYNLTTLNGFNRVDYVVLLHPCASEPLIAARCSERAPDGTMKWAKWQRVAELPDLTGFASAAASTMSEKQAAWWARSASHFGLDATVKVTKKTFAALPVLADLGVRIG